MTLRTGNKNIVLLLLLVTMLLSCKKNEPSTFQKDNYQKFFGGVYENSAVDMFLLDNNIFLTGNYIKDDKETTGILLIKTDNYGNRIWERRIEKKNNLQVYDIVPLTNNNGLALIGTYETDDSLYYTDFYMAVLNTDGTILFDKTYNYTQNETGKCIGQYSDGTFVLVGEHSEPEATEVYKFAISVSASGDIIKASRLKDGRSPQEVHSIIYDEQNDFFIVTGKFPGFIGTTSTAGIFAVNRFANFTNHFTYNISGTITDITFSDNNTYVCGERVISGTSNKARFIASVNPYFDEVFWYTESNTAFSKNASCISILNDSEIAVVGSNETELGSYDISVTKCSISGNIISEQSYGADNSEYGTAGVCDNGKIVILGTSNRDENSLLTLFKPSN